MSIAKYCFNLFLLTFTLIMPVSCSSLNPSKTGSVPPDHKLFDVLLEKYVDEYGNVDYKGFLEDEHELNSYLDQLKDNPPDVDKWSTNDQVAYWINVYNAFTVKLILDNYPVKSIKDIGAKIQIPFINSPWDIKFINIAGEEYDLNNIEHNILRKNFDEPRIHFAIVCASYSCPKLRAESYTGQQLDAQLDAQAQEFLADTTKNEISSNAIKVSKIFSWFKGDFTKNGTLIAFLNQYAPLSIDPKAKISYMDYDWALNEQD